MPASPLRILIAENQYLIAMEVERMLCEMIACEVTISPLPRWEQELSSTPFDVVILDAAGSDEINLSRAELIRATGAEPVFLSSYGDFHEQSASGSSYPIVPKPPLPEPLAAAVELAASRRGSDGKGLLDNR
ncbi:hypothetical protein ASE36_13660 [Rhizobium sp. Root274]|nr:hypothetical protein ASC71_13685 [Rhizobium sp. Root1240]KRD29658.1 hypothetical protein ASE36_13660 [Rhizobium sp. Root274]